METCALQDRLTFGQTYYYWKPAKGDPYLCNKDYFFIKFVSIHQKIYIRIHYIIWYKNSYMVGFCIRLESSH